ncbi:MAG: bifunctional riboflavin kinase/FAD synthetase [Planctomycetes bacterium]|nr:bifunctional riboflavin kinase/FAD synthetase [Planctomycetota bacterium]
MAAIHLSFDEPIPTDCLGGAATIGNFDGVHRGHQELIAETIRQARNFNGSAIAITFDPHPQQLLRPESFQPVLTTLAERGRLLEGLKLDHVVVLRITPEFLRLTAREFFDRIISKGFQARAIVEGFNFGFGRGREGDGALLQKLGEEAGVAVALVGALEFEGKPIATSRIRGELLAGNVVSAAAMLGRPYRLQGKVGVGQKRGQKLGFPTANLGEIATLVPGNGVYAVRVHHENKSWPGAANIGPNPTFGEQERKAEVHLIGFQGDLYGASLTVDFVERIRDTRKFSGAVELVEQLNRDVAAASRVALATESGSSCGTPTPKFGGR